MVVVEVEDATVSMKLPRLPTLSESPEYEALMVIGEAVEEGLYWSEQAPPESVQVLDGEKTPNSFVVQATAPLGLKPLTVAVQVVEALGGIDWGEQETDVLERVLTTTSLNVPELL